MIRKKPHYDLFWGGHRQPLDVGFSVCPSSVRLRDLLVKTYNVHDDNVEEEEEESEGEKERRRDRRTRRWRRMDDDDVYGDDLDAFQSSASKGDLFTATVMGIDR